MARIACLGPSLKTLYLIDHDDLVPTNIGDSAILGKVLVGKEVEIDKIKESVGGSGLNSAVTFARHDHETILISNIGKGGENIISTLNHENIDSSFINISQYQNTGTSIILLDEKSRERTILTNQGVASNTNELAQSDIDLIDPDWLYATTTYGNLEKLDSFFKKAQQNQTKVAFHPTEKEVTDSKKFFKILKNVDVLILNKDTAKLLIQTDNILELLEHLRGYVKTTIITDGQSGAIATDSKETYRLSIYEEPSIKDRTGAGDAFASGFIAHIADGNSFKSSLVFASANASSVINKVDSISGILTGREKLHPMPIQKI